MKNLLLVTQGFPYGESERGFLPTEYETLNRHFHLTVLSFGTTEPLHYPVNEKVDHRRYDWGGNLTPIGLLRQLRYKEVRQDIDKALVAGLRLFPMRTAKILAFSLRAEQITDMMRQLIVEKNIDIIYTYWCIQATTAALRLKTEFPQLKVITRFHGMDLYPERMAEKWEPLRPHVAENSDLLLFVSELGKTFFLDTWGRQWEAKARVSYVGCRKLPGIESTEAQTLTLVSCSALLPVKRVHRIIEGLAALPEDVAINWHHFGGGELSDELQAKASVCLANRSTIQYTFHGHVQNTRLPEMYQEIGAQLFITTSESEGLPVSMMEAYAMGIPVIATAVGGIPEMVRDGENGFLLSADPCADEIAQAIMRYIELPDARIAQMSQCAQDSWRMHFDAAANAEKLVSLIDQL